MAENNDPYAAEDYTKKWTDTETRRLIALFKENQVLWNLNSRDYRNRKKKLVAIRSIGEELNVDPAEVQRKWHNLRTQYNSELKKARRRSSGLSEDEMFVSLWPYFSALKFIEVNKPSTSSFIVAEEVVRRKEHDDDLNESWAGTPLTEQEDEDVDKDSVGTIAPPKKKYKTNHHKQNMKVLPEVVQINHQYIDEDQIFGDFCASELRQLLNPDNRRVLKSIVMEFISEVAEADMSGKTYRRTSATSQSSSPMQYQEHQ